MRQVIRYLQSSCYASTTAPSSENVPPREKQLLRGIGRYLRSRIALYLVATIGRRWLMDRRNLEPTDLAVFPVPILGLEDPAWTGYWTLKGRRSTASSLRHSASKGTTSAVEEFLGFRMGFQDGDVPEKALGRPNADVMASMLRFWGTRLGA